MRADVPQEQIRRLLTLPPDELRAWIAKLRPEELLLLDTAFETWADEGQLQPPGEGWRVWLMLAGRGFGKTRAGAEWVHRLAAGRRVRIALVAASIDEALRVMVEESSQAGARRALASLGLDDERARRDMDELRELLSAWRDAKRSAWRAVVTWAVSVCLALLLVGLAVRLGLTNLVAP